MNARTMLSNFSGLLILGTVIMIGLGVASLFIYGAAWVSRILLPFISILMWILFALVVFVFLPLAIPRATRGFSSVALLIASHVFGAVLWMRSLLLTLFIWGVGAVIVGVLLAGVGVVPIAMLATLFGGQWGTLLELVLLTVMTFATRYGAVSLAVSLEE